MSWTRGRRELCLSGRLPLEQGAIFEQAIWDIAKQQRAADKQTGSVLEWQQSAADALVTLAQHGGGERGGVRRSATTLIVHLSDDAPPFIEGAGPLSRETAERLACDARRLTIKPSGRDLVHSRVGRCASYAQLRALHKRSDHCQYPGCTATRELEAHHLVADEDGGKTELANLILLCHATPQAPARPPHPHQRHRRRTHLHGRGRTPDHHQPTTRTVVRGARRALPCPIGSTACRRLRAAAGGEPDVRASRARRTARRPCSS